MSLYVFLGLRSTSRHHHERRRATEDATRPSMHRFSHFHDFKDFLRDATIIVFWVVMVFVSVIRRVTDLLSDVHLAIWPYCLSYSNGAAPRSFTAGHVLHDILHHHLHQAWRRTHHARHWATAHSDCNCAIIIVVILITFLCLFKGVFLLGLHFLRRVRCVLVLVLSS